MRVKKDELSSDRGTKEISTAAIRHNINEIKKVIPQKTTIMGVVKANGYGCGMIEVARELEENGITFFCVATIDEAIALRKSGNQGEILILGYTHPNRIHEIKNYHLIQSIVSEEHGEMLSLKKVPIRCHLQIDTGMHRLGVAPDVKKIQQLYLLPNLKIEGIYSHLGSSDSLEKEAILRTQKQIKVYRRILVGLKEIGLPYGYTHIQSSYGVLNYPELEFDFVRIGIILYGFLSEYNFPTKIKLDLQPIVEIKAALVVERFVEAGEYIGYGLGVKLEEKKRIGVVSIGYADGLPRSLSDTSFKLVFNGQPLKQIGNICMDMLIVDLTGIAGISINDEITVLSNIEKIAYEQETITNEILSRLGTRLNVRVK